MSKGGFQNPKYANQSGTTSGYGSQGNFGMGYTQPYGSPGTGTYDPMLGFGQASGMGTTYNYPTRYTADYTRYAQSGQPFNPAVMGYNSYGQIFAQPQRPPPSMGKGGGGFQPQPPAMGGKGRVSDPGISNDRPRLLRAGGDAIDPNAYRPTTIGGKGGPKPENDGVTISYPGGSRTVPRNPQRRSNQIGLVDRYGPGPIQPAVQPEYAYPTDQSPQVAYEYNQAPSLVDGLPVGPVAANRSVIDENIYNSPFNQLIGGLGGMGGNPPRPEDFTRPILDQLEPQPSFNRPPPGMMRNPNYSPTSSMLDNVPPPGSDEYLRRQLFIPASGGLGGMPKPIVGPYQGKIEIPYQGEPADLTPVQQQGEPVAAQQASGSVGQNMNNPAYQQQMAFEQGNSEEAIRNRIQRQLNEQFTRDQNSGMTGSALYKAQDELQNKLYSQYGLNPYQMGPQSMSFFQEGGQVPPDAAANMEMMMAETAQPEMAGEYDRLIQMTMQAILGQVESPDEVIQMFIDEFGVDAFRQLREAVLKQQVPGAQTEGMVDGNGGGMDDQVMGMIGNQRPVAVSPGEYIVPADVVSGLGDGSSKSGADILDELNQAVRMARTGTTQQPRPLMETLQQ